MSGRSVICKTPFAVVAAEAEGEDPSIGIDVAKTHSTKAEAKEAATGAEAAPDPDDGVVICNEDPTAPLFFRILFGSSSNFARE
mmetsp:Transcript_20633/g.31866  ORF Transcript_20633/g.31866 Transcript_20633/m.31866 type:complete len:84 (-) Transcript_20633:206-457(-)|eukprot:CAMPEP_0194273364 /NCGR_PEP_ID=MMETSP0169-20130528/6711_1 /TAXON_ID=218684 /ORGANISM="Corethron pennatum, Strain L29A3" /LENGTH=83 /DNA_ID=CAMNT_0039016293 /DNA_START=569 /DNA_END=820 /DNA_ORIENTATION=-